MGSLLRWSAVLAMLGFPIAVVGSRLGFYDFRLGFDILKYSVFAAAAIFLFALILSFVQRNSNPISAKASRFAAVICLIPLLGIGSQVMTARSLPSIHNISTDTVNPPSFDRVIELREEGSNPLDYDAEKLSSIQLEAYPNVKTLRVDASLPEAFAQALTLANDMGWGLVNEDSAAGIIEATETTTLWAFKDDIVIRVKESGDKTAIDLRSVSRVGQSDLGANANRIEKFLEKFQE